jgi:hypothetical protein
MPKEGDKPFIFVEKRKGEGNQDKSLEPKAMNKSESKSGGPSQKKQS